MKRLLLILAVLLSTALSSFGTKYYVDYGRPDDTGDGLTRATAWKRDPWMANFGHAYTHQAGDRFIHKGGVEWPSAEFGGANGRTISNSGKLDGTGDDYYGVEEDWFAGASFTRPIFNFGSNSVARHNCLTFSSVQYITFDDIEMKGFHWDASVGGANEGAFLLTGSLHLSFKRCYIHGWSHDQSNILAVNGTRNTYAFFLHSGSGFTLIEDTIIDGSDSMESHNGSTFGSAQFCYAFSGTIRRTKIKNISNGILGNGTFEDNEIGPILYGFQDLYDDQDHQNSIESNYPQDCIIRRNYIHDAVEVCIFMAHLGQNGGAIENDQIYDNVITNSAPVPIQFRASTGGNSALVANNTIVGNPSTPNSYVVRGDPTYTVTERNNHIIDGTESNGVNVTADHNLLQSTAVALNAGYTSSNLYQPTSNTSPTVNQGVALTSFFATDFNNISRPQGAAWDVGAYEYGSIIGPTPTAAPTPTPTPSPGGPVISSHPQSVKSIIGGHVTFKVTTSGANIANNGSFEPDLTGWTTSGNFSLQTAATFPAQATNGTHWIVFNDGNRVPNAVLSQTVSTVSGQSYSISFDLGVNGFQSTAEQKLQVKAQGATTRLNQNVSVFGQGTGYFWAARQTLNFTADSSSTVISLTDVTVSANTTNEDMMLDNVTISGALPATYQWRKDGGNIAGATNSTLILDPVTSSSFGIYDVVVSNGAGSTTSNQATLGQLFLLQKNATNPRYFFDGMHSVYLAGEHIPTDLQNWVGAPFIDFVAFTDSMQAKNMNLLRLWALDTPFGSHLDGSQGAISPVQFQRPGPGTAADGLPKFDLSKVDQNYLNQVRSRVIEAGSKGLYVTVAFITGAGGGNYGPYKASNNINANMAGITDADLYTLNNNTPNNALNGYLFAYIDALVDKLNDLDNVMWELLNEPPTSNDAWQEAVITRVKAREANLPKQHFIGRTAHAGGVPDNTSNSTLLSSACDWMAPSGRGTPSPGLYTTNIPDASTAKVSIIDTDHTVGFAASGQNTMLKQAVWKGLTRGHNNEFITPQTGYPGGFVNLPEVEAAVGYSRTMADRCDLLHMPPNDTASDTTFALVNPNTEYLVYQPSNSSFHVTLPLTIN